MKNSMKARLFEYLFRFETWWFPAVRIWGREETHHTLYLTRWFLSPPTPWGRLYLHRFHRQDLDRDPHDHPFNFWTVPLGRGYFEEVYEHVSDCFHEVFVPPWRISLRPARHRHRIIRPIIGTFPMWTLVWRGPNVRKWGFWVWFDGIAERSFVPWKDYVYGGAGKHEMTGEDHACPGADMSLAQATTMERDAYLRRVPSEAGEQTIKGRSFPWPQN